MPLSRVLFALLVLGGPASHAQQLQWLRATPIQWDLNPDVATHLISASPNGLLFGARPTGNGFVYGSDVFGQVLVERIDAATGASLAGCALGDSALVESMVVRDDGMAFFGGRYMGHLSLCDGQVMSTGGGPFDMHLFLLAMNADGLLLWAKDLTLDHADAQRVPALALDANGMLWCGLEEFEAVRLVQLDAQGQELQTRTIEGTRSLGGLAFTSQNELYATGSTSGGPAGMTFGGVNVPVPDAYMMFVLHMHADGTGHWARLAHDVTFQSPNVAVDSDGNAYVAGELLDAASFGNVHLHGPQWLYDVFLAKVDASGDFLWGVESAPAGSPPILGDLQRGRGPCLAVDGQGHSYLTGSMRGSVDWGGGVVSEGASLTQQTQTIVAFSADGAPLWARTSTPSDTYVAAQCITCDDNGALWFATHVNGQFDLDPFSVDQGGDQAFCDGRIDALAEAIAPTVAPDHLVAFPSPAADELTVVNDGAPRPMDLFNAEGRLVAHWSVPAGARTMDVHALPPGPYVLRGAAGEQLRWIKR